VDWYVQAVEQAVSATATEAVLAGVVELLAVSPEDFLAQAGTRGIPWQGGVLRFEPGTARISAFEPGLRHRLLAWVLDPQVAYLLLIGGLAGLFFELTSPGAIFPGVFGGICLLLGLYALSILPTNAAGVLLILFGLVLFLLELKVTSFGLLTIAGMAALFFRLDDPVPL